MPIVLSISDTHSTDSQQHHTDIVKYNSHFKELCNFLSTDNKVMMLARSE